MDKVVEKLEAGLQWDSFQAPYKEWVNLSTENEKCKARVLTYHNMVNHLN